MILTNTITLDTNFDTQFRGVANVKQGRDLVITINNLPYPASPWSWRNTTEPTYGGTQTWDTSNQIQFDSGTGSASSVVISGTTAIVTVPLPTSEPNFGIGKSFSFIYTQVIQQIQVFFTVVDIDATGGTGTLLANGPITFSAPLALNGTNVSIPQADGAHDGYLSMTDWLLMMANLDKSFVQDFTASSVITVNHNFGRYATPFVMDSSNNQILPDIQQVNTNQLIVTLKHPTSGKVICN